LIELKNGQTVAHRSEKLNWAEISAKPLKLLQKLMLVQWYNGGQGATNANSEKG